MNQVVILEGPDGGGKSTLAGYLRQRHGFRVERSGVPSPRWNSDRLFRHYVLSLWKALLRRDQPVVFDRHYLGETIYGPVMREGSLLSPLQVRLIERLVRAHDVKVVLVLPPRPVALSNWRQKRQDYVDREERWNRIFSAYERLLLGGHGPYLGWDYTREQQDTLEHGDQTLALFSPNPRLPPNVIGSPDASLLVVGEQVNLRRTSTDWAFFGDASCSGYLNRALEVLPEQELAFCNALRVNHEARDLGEVVAQLPRFRTAVALGRTAERVLRQQGIPHHQLPHPQYVARFHHDKLPIYRELFRRVYDLPRGGEYLCVTKL